MLHAWGLLEAHTPRKVVFPRLGVHVTKAAIPEKNPLRGIVKSVGSDPVDLVVLSTEGREGLPRSFQPSVAEGVVRHLHAPALFVPSAAGGFADANTDELSLRSVLIPLTHDLSPQRAVDTCIAILETLVVTPQCIDLVHIGTDCPTVNTSAQGGWNWQQHVFEGEAVESLLAAAHNLSPDLVVIPTKGHHGFLDAFRGGDTERLVRHAPWPVLAVPVTSAGLKTV
jgi:nucleotide-binding universal stress UspA family protein